MIKNRPRCRGAARKSGRDWRVETAHKREYDGGCFWQCAVHGAVPNSRAAPCHTAVILTWELCGDGQLDLHGAKAEALASAATDTGSGEIYMFEQCTSHVATATQATLERLPETIDGSAATTQEAAAGIPEGTPPSSPSTAAAAPDRLAHGRRLVFVSGNLSIIIKILLQQPEATVAEIR